MELDDMFYMGKRPITLRVVLGLMEDADKTYSVTYCIRTAKGRRKHVFSVWRMADNPNYGRVVYATLVEQEFLWPFVSEHPSEDDNLV